MLQMFWFASNDLQYLVIVTDLDLWVDIEAIIRVERTDITCHNSPL